MTTQAVQPSLGDAVLRLLDASPLGQEARRIAAQVGALRAPAAAGDRASDLAKTELPVLSRGIRGEALALARGLLIERSGQPLPLLPEEEVAASAAAEIVAASLGLPPAKPATPGCCPRRAAGQRRVRTAAWAPIGFDQ
ncbi:MAG TPA: hypothetical protein VMS17_17800 [Gemmataceae bacterium]|nr:hypothetical protein [Gemmataceae bacterium]